MIPKLRERIVLDTNVCLDLFVFRDPQGLALQQALHDDGLEAVTRPDCRTEWTLVLAYGKLGLDPDAQQAALAAFDELVSTIDMPVDTPVDTAVSPPQLPFCADPDDQKFLELAAASGATCLLSKDKALLKLARRTRKLGLFEIMSPQEWLARRERALQEACRAALQ